MKVVVPRTAPREASHRPAVLAWCAALRSGRYSQGMGYLRSQGRYCCLGVAEDVRDAVWVGNDAIQRPADSFSSHTLGRIAMNWLGVDENAPLVYVPFAGPSGPILRLHALTYVNDDLQLPFPLVADVIEFQLPGWDGTRRFALRNRDELVRGIIL